MSNDTAQPLEHPASDATNSTVKGAAVALAVASLVGCTTATTSTSSQASATAASAGSAGTTDLAHCYGANICKGHNDCKTASNACAGQGACKGQGGFVTAPVKACGDIGGEVRDAWRGSVASADLVHCYGVNVCKGHNDCKTANNACAGQGACKGQGGFVALTTKACGDVGGKVGA